MCGGCCRVWGGQVAGRGTAARCGTPCLVHCGRSCVEAEAGPVDIFILLDALLPGVKAFLPLLCEEGVLIASRGVSLPLFSPGTFPILCRTNPDPCVPVS